MPQKRDPRDPRRLPDLTVDPIDYLIKHSLARRGPLRNRLYPMPADPLLFSLLNSEHLQRQQLHREGLGPLNKDKICRADSICRKLMHTVTTGPLSDYNSYSDEDGRFIWYETAKKVVIFDRVVGLPHYLKNPLFFHGSINEICAEIDESYLSIIDALFSTPLQFFEAEYAVTQRGFALHRIRLLESGYTFVEAWDRTDLERELRTLGGPSPGHPNCSPLRFSLIDNPNDFPAVGPNFPFRNPGFFLQTSTITCWAHLRCIKFTEVCKKRLAAAFVFDARMPGFRSSVQGEDVVVEDLLEPRAVHIIPSKDFFNLDVNTPATDETER